MGKSANEDLVAHRCFKQAKIFVSSAKAPRWDINLHADIIGKKHCDLAGLCMCHPVLRSNDWLWAKCAKCVNLYVRGEFLQGLFAQCAMDITVQLLVVLMSARRPCLPAQMRSASNSVSF